MDPFIIDLIEKRAKAIGSACQEILNYQNESDEIAGTGFRWAYLIIRKPKLYLEAFKHGDLRIDPSMLEEVFWLHQECLSGTCTLLPVEREILKVHNEESALWMRNGSNVISLTKKDYHHP